MQKIVKLNRAFLYCCMVVTFSLYFKSYAAPTQGKPVSLTIKNSTLADVLRQVSKKSGLYIYFQDADLAAHKNVTIDVRNKPVENVLHELLDGRGFSWVEVSENTIAVKKKPFSEERVEGDTVATITVTGKVVDEKGEPLPGTTVVVKNSKIGTITNSNGEFVLNDIKANALIVISNVSSMAVEIPVRGRTTIGKVQLKEKVGELDEIVVIPYGTTTRRLSTSNVVSIKADEIERQPINNPLYALQGRVAGLQITPTSGLAGGAVNLQIRGQNSLTQQSDPLVVIDGLPVVNNIAGLGHLGFQTSNGNLLSSLSFINPNEIESIEILKNADATSIYGSRGANGVILITTKKGSISKGKIDLNIQSGWAKVPREVKMLNTQQYLSLRKEAFQNSNIDISTTPLNSTSADLKFWDQNRYTNWQKELIGKVAKYQDVQGSFYGGSEWVQYLVGGNYHSENSVFSNKNKDEKVSAHLSLSGSSPDQSFRASVNASYMVDNNTLPGTDLTYAAVTLAPNAPSLYDSLGNLNWAQLPSGGRSWNNPHSDFYKRYESRITNLVSSAQISYRILRTLNIKAQLGFNELRGKAFNAYYPFAGRPPEELSNEIAGAEFTETAVKNISFEPHLDYNNSYGKSSITILLGGSIQSTDKEDQSINAVGATSDALLKNLSAATFYMLRNSSSQYKYAALYGRLSYNYNNRYLLNISARRDGSSRFGPGNQFGTFGSVGLAWIFTEENLVKQAFSFLSFGKLRASCGTSGNDGIGDYKYLERYQPIDVSDLYQGVRGYRTAGLFNSYYAWEVTKKLEIGMEGGFFKDRVYFNFSFYRNRSNNQLLGQTYPTMAGPGAPIENSPATIQNKGIELEINSVNIKSKNFEWSTSINFTRIRNKLISYPDIENSSNYNLVPGEPFYGISHAYNFAGVDKITGRYQFLTADQKLTDNPNDPTRGDYGQYIRIFTLPKYYGGIGNSIHYKGLNVDFLFQFCKQLGVNHINQFVYLVGNNRNVPVEFDNRWRKEGDNSTIQKVYLYRPIEYTIAASSLTASNFAYVDASFIRLKNISISYDVPVQLKRRLKVESLKVYVRGQNMLTFTKYKGLDPETQSLNNLPPLRVTTIGLKVGI